MSETYSRFGRNVSKHSIYQRDEYLRLRKSLSKKANREYGEKTCWIGGKLYFSKSLEEVPGVKHVPKPGSPVKGNTVAMPQRKNSNDVSSLPVTPSFTVAIESVEIDSDGDARCPNWDCRHWNLKAKAGKMKCEECDTVFMAVLPKESRPVCHIDSDGDIWCDDCGEGYTKVNEPGIYLCKYCGIEIEAVW